MKVLFVNPPFTGWGGMEGHGGSSAPLNLAYLASYLRVVKPETEIEIFDAEGLRIGFDAVEERIREFKPDIVGITTPTPAFPHALQVAERAKKVGRNIQVALGGPHPSGHAEQCAEEADVDFAFFMESEVSFSEVVDKLDKGGSMGDVGGIVYKDSSGKVKRNAPPVLIEDLDTIPFPARDLLPLDIYFPPATKRVSGKKSANMITSRGCPYNCTYCESKLIWTRKARYRSTQNVVDEIEQCVTQYGLGEFNFHDDIFPLNAERTIDICKEIQRRKLDISWVCMSRVNIAREDVFQEMKRAGCRKIMFGLESGSNELLEIMKKKATTEEAVEAVKLCHKVGISTMGSFMLGNIGETKDTIRQTINFAKRLKLDTAAFFVTSPYPGTELYEVAAKNGWIRNDFNWEDFVIAGGGKPVLTLPDVTPEELKYWQSRALREFYLRPSYIVRKLLSLRSLEEWRSMFQGLGLFRRIGLTFGQA